METILTELKEIFATKWLELTLKFPLKILVFIEIASVREIDPRNLKVRLY